jgi:hypothetical protein
MPPSLLAEEIARELIIELGTMSDSDRSMLKWIVALQVDIDRKIREREVLLAPQAAPVAPPAPANDMDLIMPLRSNWNTPKRDRIA